MLAAAAGVLIASAAGWYWGSPWWTLWRMREAAQAGDLARLASYTDARAIEAEAKAQARRSWGSIEPAVRGDARSNGRFIALARRMLAEAKRYRFRAGEVRDWLADTPILGRRDGDPYVVHRGLDRFEVRYRGTGLENGPILAFRRHGLGWKLAGVRWGQQ